jgi:WD40 repeat protein
VSISRDGRKAATGSYDEHALKLWDVEKGALIGNLVGHSDFVVAVAFSPDGQAACLREL